MQQHDLIKHTVRVEQWLYNMCLVYMVGTVNILTTLARYIRLNKTKVIMFVITLLVVTHRTARATARDKQR